VSWNSPRFWSSITVTAVCATQCAPASGLSCEMAQSCFCVDELWAKTLSGEYHRARSILSCGGQRWHLPRLLWHLEAELLAVRYMQVRVPKFEDWGINHVQSARAPVPAPPPFQLRLNRLKGGRGPPALGPAMWRRAVRHKQGRGEFAPEMCEALSDDCTREEL